MWGASCRPFTKPLSKVLGVPVVCLPARTRSYQSARVSRVLKRFRDHNKQLIVLDDGSYFLEVRRGYWCVAASGLFQAFLFLGGGVEVPVLLRVGVSRYPPSLLATLGTGQHNCYHYILCGITVAIAPRRLCAMCVGNPSRCPSPFHVACLVGVYAPPPSLSLPLVRDFCLLSAGIKYHETVW